MSKSQRTFWKFFIFLLLGVVVWRGGRGRHKGVVGGFLLNYSYTAVDTAVDLLGDASRGRMLKGLSRLQQQGTTVLERTRASSRIQENEENERT